MESDKQQWHPAFCGATELELRENRNDLTFEDEHYLSRAPMRIDMLVVKKHPTAIIKNEIGKIFRGHNLIEFKGFGDSLSIDTLYKGIAYACLYKSMGKRVDEIPAEEVSLTFMRVAYPKKLFTELREKGCKVEERYPGIYYLIGNVIFPIQVIVIKDLDSEKHAGLKILTKEAKEEDIRKFLTEARLAKEPGDLANIDAILQVSVSANRKSYETVREDKDMCQALRELMQDEIREEIKEERADEHTTTKLEDIKNVMKSLKVSAEQAMDTLCIPKKDRAVYIAML